ncbi:helix-turn-helix domain-containing protein [Modicisalibacter sp. MOD 31.J]|uniref:helix-turn-helix transcriptional regulator n=1 Tax=Modicisalibacter sp. MOD 31.J TaxID=2831897 RepID=UPI001CCC9243|nr:helix-turn-helix domain-containing protein [Modicisalibacter sp. MOD 31.J]MBZ9574473.1 helix-turn-helix domain-containing protein [Modicisalibacter sp. MOD 31.J]
MVKGYLTTNDLCARYKINRRTLYRWMERKERPLPAPRISGKSGFNRWAIDDIEDFELSFTEASEVADNDIQVH